MIIVNIDFVTQLHGGNFWKWCKTNWRITKKYYTELFDFDLSVLGFKKEDIPEETIPNERISSFPEFIEGFFNELGERILVKV